MSRLLTWGLNNHLYQIPEKALSHLRFRRTTSWRGFLEVNFTLQVLEFSSSFWCTDMPHAYFVAVSAEKRRFLLAEVLNVRDGQVFDQRTQRDKSFTKWIVLQFKFSNFCDHVQHMVIFTPIVWLDAFLQVKAASLNIKSCSEVYILSGWSEQGDTEASCGIWIMCYIFQKKDNTWTCRRNLYFMGGGVGICPTLEFSFWQNRLKLFPFSR